MRIVILFVSVLMGFAAAADDGGVVGIKVGDIQFKSSQWANGNTTDTSIKVDENSPSYTVNINGGEAAKLMVLLPSSLSVETAAHGKAFAKLYNKNFKALLIRGKAGQPDVTLNCEGGSLDYDHLVGNEPPKFQPHADGAHCSIQITQQADEGDTEFNFNPTKAVCGK